MKILVITVKSEIEQLLQKVPTDASTGGKAVKEENLEIRFASQMPDLEDSKNYDFLVLDSRLNVGNPSETIKVDNQILQYLKSNGNLIIHFNELPDTSHPASAQHSGASHFVIKLLNYLRFAAHNNQSADQRIQVLHPAFQSFIRNYGASTTHFSATQHSPQVDIISHIESSPSLIRSFSTKELKGRLVFLSCSKPDSNTDSIDFFKMLCKAGKAYFNNFFESTNLPWLEDFAFQEEETLKLKAKQLRDELATLDKVFEKNAKPKTIFHFRGNVLAQKLAKWFEQNLSIPTLSDEQYREDFAILNEEKKEIIALCEVKSIGNNVKLPYLQQASALRAKYEKTEDFPVILIADTFNAANTIKDKIQPIDGKTAQEACAPTLNVLVMRLVDIVNLYDLYQTEKIRAKEIIDLLTKNVGWLKVENGAWLLEKGAKPPSLPKLNQK